MAGSARPIGPGVEPGRSKNTDAVNRFTRSETGSEKRPDQALAGLGSGAVMAGNFERRWFGRNTFEEL
jgi:hypothetical protein